MVSDFVPLFICQSAVKSSLLVMVTDVMSGRTTVISTESVSAFSPVPYVTVIVDVPTPAAVNVLPLTVMALVLLEDTVTVVLSSL